MRTKALQLKSENILVVSSILQILMVLYKIMISMFYIFSFIMAPAFAFVHPKTKWSLVSHVFVQKQEGTKFRVRMIF